MAVAATEGRVRSSVRGGEALLRARRNDRITQCDSVYGEAPTGRLHTNPVAVSGSVHNRKTNQLIRRCHPFTIKSAAQAILSRMQLTLHATRRIPHVFALGASDVCLVDENPTCSVPAW